MKLDESTVKDLLEESICAWCGLPIAMGDRFVWSETTGDDYCSAVCAENDAFDAAYGTVACVGGEDE